MSGLQRATVTVSASWTFFDGAWHEGNVAIMGPRTHAVWLGSMVFDGARAFEGVMPLPPRSLLVAARLSWKRAAVVETMTAAIPEASSRLPPEPPVPRRPPSLVSWRRRRTRRVTPRSAAPCKTSFLATSARSTP